MNEERRKNGRPTEGREIAGRIARQANETFYQGENLVREDGIEADLELAELAGHPGGGYAAHLCQTEKDGTVGQRRVPAQMVGEIVMDAVEYAAQGNEKPVREVAKEKMPNYLHDPRRGLHNEIVAAAEEAGDLERIKQQFTDRKGNQTETTAYIEAEVVHDYLKQLTKGLM